jgi:hypothetical protein
MCQSTACGKCRFCHYAPVTVDAAICPRCSGWAPNPGLFSQFRVGVHLVVNLILSLIFIALLLTGAFVNPASFFYAIPFIAGPYRFVYTLVRPYGGPQ